MASEAEKIRGNVDGEEMEPGYCTTSSTCSTTTTTSSSTSSRVM